MMNYYEMLKPLQIFVMSKAKKMVKKILEFLY